MGKYEERQSMGDRVIESMMRDVAPRQLDPEKTRAALTAALESLKKQAEHLSTLDYSAMEPDKLAKTMTYTSKMLDEIFRLSEFSQGRADSRPELQGGGLLEHLTDGQIEELSRWVAEGKNRTVETKPKDQLLQ